MWYILDGHAVVKVDAKTWEVWMSANFLNRHVADWYWKRKNKVYRLSTVFMGLDHNFSSVGLPLLFETMVFVGGESKDMLGRYPTWTMAYEGHVDRWKRFGSPKLIQMNNNKLIQTDEIRKLIFEKGGAK